MSTSDTCKDCLRLWRLFTSATTAYYELLRQADLLQQQEGLVDIDLTQLPAIRRQVETTAARRQASRNAFYRHLATAHLKEGSTRAAQSLQAAAGKSGASFFHG